MAEKLATPKISPAQTNGHAEAIAISAPNFRFIALELQGTAPYLQARFSEKAMRQMAETMEAGSTAKKGRKREPRDFDADYRNAMHLTADGQHGIPAAAFRNCAIDACRMAGFQMTKAKMSVFIVADAFDAVDGAPLVLLRGTPEPLSMAVRNASGVADLRMRPMWREWSVTLRVRFDADQFTAADVTNLFHRAGLQVGVGEGRPFSKASNGLGYGTFSIVNPEEGGSE
jgi:hypothetical protein